MVLKLTVPGQEYFNEETSEFITVGDFELELEHSLVAVSKWESKTHKPFLTKDDKTPEEIKLYVEGMILNPIYPADIITRLTQENFDSIHAYIQSAESATTFGDPPEVRGKVETVTSELIYYWMVMFNISLECEQWHLNRLLSLIRIANLKSSKPKKMSRQQLNARNKALNEKRRAQLNTSG